MLPQGGVAEEPDPLIPDVHCLQVLRVVPVQGGEAVEDRQPVALLPRQQGLLGPGKIVIRHPAQGEDLPRVAALGLDGAQLPCIPDGHGPLVDLPADALAVRVVTGGGENNPHRLVVGGAGSAGHHVPHLPARLGVQFVENHTTGFISVFGKGLGGQNLHQPHGDPPQRAVFRLQALAVLNPFLGADDPQLAPGDHLRRPGGGFQHEHRSPEDDAGIVLVRCAQIDFRIEFPIPKQVVEAQGGGQFALAVLLGDLQIQVLVLPEQPPCLFVLVHGGVELHQGFPLPVVQVKTLPGAGCGQALHKVAHKAPALLMPNHGSDPTARACRAFSASVNSSSAPSSLAALTRASGTTRRHREEMDSPIASAHWRHCLK